MYASNALVLYMRYEFASAVFYNPAAIAAGMSGDNGSQVYQPKYRVFLRNVPRKDVFKFQYAFVEDLMHAGPVACERQSDDTVMYHTKRGLAAVLRHENSCITMLAFDRVDALAPVWGAGELAFRALRAAQQYLPKDSYRLTLANRNQVRDLIAVSVVARMNGDAVEAKRGVIPLHYMNNWHVRESDEQITDLEERVVDELCMKHPGCHGRVSYKTTVAYAWHKEHGVLPGFEEGDIPNRLKPFVLREVVATQPVEHSETAPQPGANPSP
jgi:hypothetical protein